MDESLKNFTAFEKVEKLLQTYKYKLDVYQIQFLKQMYKKNYHDHKSYQPLELSMIHKLYERFKDE